MPHMHTMGFMAAGHPAGMRKSPPEPQRCHTGIFSPGEVWVEGGMPELAAEAQACPLAPEQCLIGACQLQEAGIGSPS